jgi:hypothetical protein
MATVPNSFTAKLGSYEVTSENIVKAFKQAAPLAVGKWKIFIELQNRDSETFLFGLVVSNDYDLAPSIYSQLVGELSNSSLDIPVAFLRNVSLYSVELKGQRGSKTIHMGLREQEQDYSSSGSLFINNIIHSAGTAHAEPLKNIFDRILRTAIQKPKGYLMAVVPNGVDREALQGFFTQGLLLDQPVDFKHLLITKDEANSFDLNLLHNQCDLITGMLGSDGITVFTDDGMVIGYNCFISSVFTKAVEVSGGARKIAFEAMKKSEHFSCCLYKSHDGPLDVWSKDVG